MRQGGRRRLSVVGSLGSRLVLGLAAVLCVGSSGWLDAKAQQLEALRPISEETPAAICSPGFALSSLRCRGRYCDDIVATCARYQVPPAAKSQSPTYWTDWFSEEKKAQVLDGSNFPKIANPYSIAVGIQCRGRYCDDLRLLMLPLVGRNNEPTMDSKAEFAVCRRSAKFSEETGSPPLPEPPQGKGMELIRRIGCSGDYCDNLTIEWCKVFHKGWNW